MADGWTQPPFEILNKSKKLADFTSWQIGSRTFLISGHAKNLIQDICRNDVEFLPFATIKGVDLFAVNVLKRISVVDWLACSGGAKITCGPFSIRNDLSTLPLLFKDTGNPATTFASDALGQIAVEHGLTGLQLADPRKSILKMIVHGQPINEFFGL